jgi:hypothetical protein
MRDGFTRSLAIASAILPLAIACTNAGDEEQAAKAHSAATNCPMPPPDAAGGGDGGGCTPTTSCAAQGRSCGTIDDGCGTVPCGTLNGACPTGESCTDGVCALPPECVPRTTCEAEGRSCGSLDDGCATVACGPLSGACPAGELCNASGVCEAAPPECVPRVTCDDVGRNCGSLDDGCATVTCGPLSGACPAGELCNASGVCEAMPPECVPRVTCDDVGHDCGSLDDGCATVVCGAYGGGCPSGQSCTSGVCAAQALPPSINFGGVVNAQTYQSNDILPGTILSIFGSNFSASGNTVYVRTGAGVDAIAAGSDYWYESPSQINATLSTSTPAGTAWVSVQNAAGLRSPEQAIVVQAVQAGPVCGNGNCEAGEDGRSCGEDCCDDSTSCDQTYQNQGQLYCRDMRVGYAWLGYRWTSVAQAVAACDDQTDRDQANLAVCGGGQDFVCCYPEASWTSGTSCP